MVDMFSWVVVKTSNSLIASFAVVSSRKSFDLVIVNETFSTENYFQMIVA